MVRPKEHETVDAESPPSPAFADPTKNVLDLVDAQVVRINERIDLGFKRADDLRAAESRRTDDLRVASDQLQLVHTGYQEKLQLAESKRIDAIRAVDVGAVATAADRAAQQATVLANQVATSAETLRALVASTQTALASQLQQMSSAFTATQTAMSTAFTERLGALEKAQYESKGKSGVTDPAIDSMLSQIHRMEERQTLSGGERRGASDSWKLLTSAVAVIATIIVIFAFFTNNRAGGTGGTGSAMQPNVVYVPVPAGAAQTPIATAPK